MELGYTISSGYEKSLNKKDIREHSIYYSPELLTRKVVESTFEEYIFKKTNININSISSGTESQIISCVENIAILEPSCGSGNFILEILYFIYRLGKSIDYEFSLSDISKNIYVFDVDEQAIKILKQRLYNIGVGNINAVCGNFLLQKINKRFDIIVGNPPYGIKNNIYLEFIKKCNNMLYDNSSIISFIVPHNIKYLILDLDKHHTLEEIEGNNFFHNASINVALIKITNTTPNMSKNISKISTDKNLSNICTIFQGVATGADRVFVVKNTNSRYYSRYLNDYIDIEKHILKDFYYPKYDNYKIIFPYTPDGKIIPEESLKKQYPKTYTYLKRCYNTLSNRKSNRNIWYGFSREQNLTKFNQEFILYAELTNKPTFLLNDNVVFSTTVYGIIVNPEYNKYNILKQLRSDRFIEYMIHNCPKTGSGFRLKPKYIKDFVLY